MDVGKLRRDGPAVKAQLTDSGDALVAKADCTIHFPKHYTGGKLGAISDGIMIPGYFGIVVGDTFAVNKTPAIMTFYPETLTTYTENETEYLMLQYGAGDVILRQLSLVKNSDTLFRVYDEIVAKGNTPWYFNHTDLSALFDEALYSAGVDLKLPRCILELISASRTRSASNKVAYFRNTLKKQEDLTDKVAEVIPLRSVAFGATSTTARIVGSYFDEGVSSALVNQNDRLESVEALLTA